MIRIRVPKLYTNCNTILLPYERLFLFSLPNPTVHPQCAFSIFPLTFPLRLGHVSSGKETREKSESCFPAAFLKKRQKIHCSQKTGANRESREWGETQQLLKMISLFYFRFAQNCLISFTNMNVFGLKGLSHSGKISNKIQRSKVLQE